MGFGAELKEAVMNPNVRTILGMIAGIGIGAAGVQVLHATNHAPVYYVAEQDISNPEGYANEFVPRAAALIKAAGGRYVAAGGVGSAGKVTGFDGDPPKSRVVIHVWDSLEQIQAWYNSPEYKEARKIGEKYAKFRSFAVDGVPQ
jgi:uncharacterized protein (DUF1330 family)